jgi:hypothetical protein
MKVSELKKKLRPLFKDRLKHMHGGWNNVKSVEKTRTLLLEIIYFSDEDRDVLPEQRSAYAQLKADVNATIQGNLPDCDIRFEVEYSKCSVEFGEAVTILHGEVQS